MRQRNTSRKGYLQGEGFVPHRQELLTAPAWRKRPRPLATILERLEIEHLRHGGKENGNLHVSYDQFAAYGISRRAVRATLIVGEALGLIEIIRDENWQGDVRQPNRYRLTYLPEKGKKAPSDEWSFLDEAVVQTIVSAYRRGVGEGQERAREVA